MSWKDYLYIHKGDRIAIILLLILIVISGGIYILVSIQKENDKTICPESEREFEAFIEKLNAYENVQYVCKPMKHEWQQRVVRIYDRDFHLIEIGESMTVIARRYLVEGISVEETAKIIQHPVEFVEICKGN